MWDQLKYKQELCNLLSETKLSLGTIRSYLYALDKFYIYTDGLDLTKIKESELVAYITQIQSKGLYLHSLTILRMLYNKVLQIPYKIKVHKYEYLKSENQLITVPHMQSMLNVTDNYKHKLAIVLIYSCMFRTNELLSIKIEDIDYESMRFIIRNEKGKPIRKVPFNNAIRPLLSLYLKKYTPDIFLFEGGEGHKYKENSIFSAIALAASKARIPYRVSAQLIRRSAIAELITHGVTTLFIKEIVGHKDVYTINQYKKIAMPSIDLVYNPIHDINIF